MTDQHTMPAAPRPSASLTAAPAPEIDRLIVIHRGRGRKSAPVIACDEVSLTVGPGEIVSVVGESGSAKTTLARAVASLGAVTSGTISVVGTPLTHRMRDDRRAAIQKHEYTQALLLGAIPSWNGPSADPAHRPERDGAASPTVHTVLPADAVRVTS